MKFFSLRAVRVTALFLCACTAAAGLWACQAQKQPVFYRPEGFAAGSGIYYTAEASGTQSYSIRYYDIRSKQDRDSGVKAATVGTQSAGFAFCCLSQGCLYAAATDFSEKSEIFRAGSGNAVSPLKLDKGILPGTVVFGNRIYFAGTRRENFNAADDESTLAFLTDGQTSVNLCVYDTRTCLCSNVSTVRRGYLAKLLILGVYRSKIYYLYSSEQNNTDPEVCELHSLNLITEADSLVTSGLKYGQTKMTGAGVYTLYEQQRCFNLERYDLATGRMVLLDSGLAGNDFEAFDNRVFYQKSGTAGEINLFYDAGSKKTGSIASGLRLLAESRGGFLVNDLSKADSTLGYITKRNLYGGKRSYVKVGQS